MFLYSFIKYLSTLKFFIIIGSLKEALKKFLSLFKFKNLILSSCLLNESVSSGL